MAYAKRVFSAVVLASLLSDWIVRGFVSCVAGLCRPGQHQHPLRMASSLGREASSKEVSNAALTIYFYPALPGGKLLCSFVYFLLRRYLDL